MATVDELLNKQKGRLQKMAESESAPTPIARKRIQRTGPTRPWQENLPQYRNARSTDTPVESKPTQAQDELLARAPAEPLHIAVVSVESELRTNLGQSSDKPRTNLGINLGQSSDKLRTGDSIQLRSPTETSDKPKTQPRTELRTNLGQSSDKPRTEEGFASLFGVQRQIVLFLYEQSKIARDKITDPIAISVLAESCGTTVLSAQKTIQRLEKKSLLRRVSFRNGRGGWTRYELSQETFQDLLHLETQDKLRTNLGQSSDKPKTQLRTQPRTSVPSSSSSLDLENFKTTTTGEPEFFAHEAVSLAPEWERIDLSPLGDIGFTQTHLIQIARQAKLSALETQDSIHFFAFDLKRNGKAKELNGPPLNFFMGILRKGMPYTPPENFEAPEEEARRKYVEGKQRLEAKRMAEAEALWDLHFREWEAKLSPEESEKFLPDYAKRPGPMRESCLKSHFNEQVWPELRESIPGYASLFVGMSLLSATSS